MRLRRLDFLKKSDSLAFLTLSLFCLIFFAKLFYPTLKIFVTPDFGLSDVLHFNYPRKFLLSEALKNNKLPLWTDNLSSGYPLFAEGETGAINPVNLFLFKFFPPEVAFNIGYIVIFFTTAVGTYLFSRYFGLTALPSLFTATVFAFSGWHISQISHFDHLQTISFLPFVFLITESLIRRPTIFKLNLLAAVLSLQILSGYPQHVFITIMGALIFLILRLSFTKVSLSHWLKTVVFFLLGTFFSIFLSAAQVLPMFQYFLHTERTSFFSLQISSAFPYPLSHLITFLDPFLLGNPAKGTYPPFGRNWGIFWENTGYIGILPLFFCLWVMPFILKNKKILTFTVLFSISLILVLGHNSPFYFLFSFPPLSIFRVPSRFFVLTTFSLAIMAGVGLEVFLKKICHKRLILGFLSILIIFFTVFQLFSFYQHYQPVGEVKTWLSPPETVQFLKTQEKGKVFALGETDPWNKILFTKGWQDLEPYHYYLNNLSANFNLLYNLPSLGFYTGFALNRPRIINELIKKGVTEDLNTKTASISSPAKNLLKLYGVSYIVSPLKVDDGDLLKIFETRPVGDLEKIFVYKLKSPKGFTFLAGEVVTAKTLEELMENLNSEDILKKNLVILEKSLPFNVKKSGGEVEVKNKTDREINIKLNLKGNALLIINQGFYPGWQAVVDGKGTPILAANLNQSAIPVSSGEHEVRLFFKSESFRVGATLSIFSLIAASLIFIFKYPRKTSPRPTKLISRPVAS